MKQAMQLEQRRDEILKEICEMRSMSRGTVSEQYLKVPRKGHKEPSICGPYWVHTRNENGKTVSRRLSRSEVDEVRMDVATHHRFKSLCSEYAELTEKLGEIEKSPGKALKKKRWKSRSKKTRR